MNNRQLKKQLKKVLKQNGTDIGLIRYEPYEQIMLSFYQPKIDKYVRKYQEQRLIKLVKTAKWFPPGFPKTFHFIKARSLCSHSVYSENIKEVVFDEMVEIKDIIESEDFDDGYIKVYHCPYCGQRIQKTRKCPSCGGIINVKD